MHITLTQITVAAAAAISTLANPPRADAHDQWANGSTVPTWVKAQCCGPSDVHHLQPSEVHVTPTGYKVDGYHTIIPEDRLSPSPDGEWWVFFRDSPDGGSQGPVYCFFGPRQGS